MIKMNSYMRILKGEGWWWNWKRFARNFEPISFDYPNVDAEILKVIVKLFGDDFSSWLNEPIVELNDYTPYQLLKSKMGTRIIQGYLMRLPYL